jgi:exodeoxyribonuclease VII small subunit
MTTTKIKYEDAITELESMVARFEKSEVSVDELVDQVRRAGELIKTCRERLQTVEAGVQSAIADLTRSVEAAPQAPKAAPLTSAPAAEAKPKLRSVSSAQAAPVAKIAPGSDVEADDPFADDVDDPFVGDSKSGSSGAPSAGGLFD